MSMRLGDDDGRAVDLFLDREQFAKENGMVSGDGFQARLQKVEWMLQLLEQLPVSDPPADLTAKTLRRLEEMIVASHSAGAPRPASQSSLGNPHPLL